MKRLIAFLLPLAALAAATAAEAEEPARPLSVLQAGPQGEIASTAEANEVRVVFSEPMVVLGRIPQPVTAPFFEVKPALPGSFRWSGTDTLIFTPDDFAKLPFATRYEVSIDGSATSVAGRRLGKPYTFAFTTPTVRLLSTEWARRENRFDRPLVVYLRFNQPVATDAIAAFVQLAYQPHDWTAPLLDGAAEARSKAADPGAAQAFQAKVARTQETVRRAGAAAFRPAKDWDRKRYPPSKDLVVLETEEAPPTDAWIRVVVAAGARGLQGSAGSPRPQDYTVKVEPTLFVDGFRCSSACDPDDYNPLRFRGRLDLARGRQATTATDATDPAKEAALKRARRPAPPGEGVEGEEEPENTYTYERSSSFTPDDLGFPLRPARTYAFKVEPTLTAADGQTLGYTWLGVVENWHQRAFTSFGTGHGVWEASGGPTLPFYSRNLLNVTQWLSPLKVDDLMPTVRSLQEGSFLSTPQGPGTVRRLTPTADKVQSFGLDLSGLLSPAGTGLAWAGLKEGRPIAQAAPTQKDPKGRSTVVQVTNLGITVKDSPANTLVLVTRLDDGEPVEGAKVSIRTLDNAVFWSGFADKDGLAVAPRTELRDPDRTWSFRFLVTAEKDGDVAYVGSDWNAGVEPWMFGLNLDLHEAKPILRGSAFSDRGVYKLGEEVHVKAVLRSDTAEGIRLLDRGTAVQVVVKDSQGDEKDRRTIALGDWSSADWAFTLPAEGPLGRYEVRASVAGQREEVVGSFLVAAYRRPDFRVDAELAGETSVTGVTLKGVVTGRYLFGAAMVGRDVKWTFTRVPSLTVPRAIEERFASDRYAFLDETAEDRFERAPETVQEKQATLGPEGTLELDLPTDVRAGRPYEYTVEGDVTDVSRQTIAGRASTRVDPAPWYIGLKRPRFFADVETGIDTEVVAVDLTGQAAAGVAVSVALTRVQWHSVRRAEGQGFYTWETERKETDAGHWEVTTAAPPVPLHVPVESGGFFILRATARDSEGHSTTTATAFYVLGPGYTAWERYDHNRIDLVPEKKTYRAGDTARIMVKSPWEKALALVTTEREGLRTWRTFRLASTQETISVPLTEAEIPNVYVSVMLVKGRSGTFDPKDTGDPGKPAFRLGYVELKVEDAARRLEVAVKSDREEYRPATRAHVEVAVKDRQGKGGPAEVTLWAVDYGVLSLTAFKTPDVLGSVYVDKALQVLTEDSRQNIISRRVVVPKGGDEGGGGGMDEGPGTPVRKDFRVLAFWLGSLVTDATGKGSADVLLPESLTTYRIMAVAGDRSSRFGRGEREIRISKPVLLKSAFPRFLAVGDTARFGSVVHSQLKEKGTAIVTMRSLDPAVLEVVGAAKKTVAMAAKGASEVQFDLKAKAVGRARVQMTVKLAGETDAFEETLPVEILASPEVMAAYGQATPEAHETVELPAGVVPSFGGLHVETSSTALVGLGEGARYLVDYPYGCAEQRSSAALALALTGDLGDAFRLPGIDPAKVKETAQATFTELEAFQCDDGGFAFWKGECRTESPYLTSYVLHVLQRGKRLDYAVTPSVLDKGYGYLEHALGGQKPTNEGWWPAYTAWQAFAVKVLTEGGRPQDSHVTRLFSYLDRMPVFGLAYLRDAMAASGEKGPRPEEIDRRLRNAILPEGGSAHVEELSDPYLLWFWSSNVRSTALVLGTFVRTGAAEELVPRMVRWLMAARKKGRWGNTQENGTAMEALVDYYKKYEAEPPDFRAVVTLGTETLATPEFHGRSTVAQATDMPMRDLAGKGAPGTRLDLAFRKEGAGNLFYVARLKYAVDALQQEGMDQGFRIERAYAPHEPDGAAALTTFKAGDLVSVTLTVHLTKERRFVAVTDPLPAGFEPVESWFATTAGALAGEQQREETGGDDWFGWWRRGGFDRVERHDDRVLLFATRLSEGDHSFTYVVRATTSGTFRTAPAHAEEMYEPEVFGRTPTAVITVGH